MKVILKFGHHNGERFYKAGEVMECPEKLGKSLIRQGLAVLFTEKKEEPKQPSGNADNSDTPAESGSSGSGANPEQDEKPEEEKALQGQNSPEENN